MSVSKTLWQALRFFHQRMGLRIETIDGPRHDVRMQKSTPEPIDASKQVCPNSACSARGKIGEGNIRIHDRKRQRYRCTRCKQTFSARRGTIQEWGSWLERLQQEHENLRAALAWLVEHNEREAALRLGGALWRIWLIRGHLSEGRTELARAMAGSQEVERSVRAKALCAARQGDFAQAKILCGESLALFRALGDPEAAGLP
jgi:hypothetical protein